MRFSIVTAISFGLFLGVAISLSHRWGWWKDGHGRFGWLTMKWTRVLLIIFICSILSNVVREIFRKTIWNNSQEENTVKTQTKLVE
jgi:hypothetical protein